MKLLIIGIIFVWIFLIIPIIMCLKGVWQDFQEKKENELI